MNSLVGGALQRALSARPIPTDDQEMRNEWKMD